MYFFVIHKDISRSMNISVYLYIQGYKYIDRTDKNKKNNTHLIFFVFNSPIAYMFLQHMGVWNHKYEYQKTSLHLHFLLNVLASTRIGEVDVIYNGRPPK